MTDNEELMQKITKKELNSSFSVRIIDELIIFLGQRGAAINGPSIKETD